MVAWPFGPKSIYLYSLRDTNPTDNALRSSLELRARWTIFTTPLAHIIQFADEKAGPLKGCVLCVSEDGTVAVIVIDGLQL